MTHYRRYDKKFSKDQREMVDKFEASVERAKKTAEASKQPRFSDTPQALWSNIRLWYDDVFQNKPPYLPDSRVLDTWLTRIWKLEPHIAGVVSSVVNVDKNRGWSLIGGRNQVSAYTNYLHQWMVAPNVFGWRHGVGAASTAFWTTNMGMLVEVGRQGDGGPMRQLYHLDPTRCALTGDPQYPLTYYPAKGSTQQWTPEDYFRCASMLELDEIYNGLGYCALARAVELTQIMMAVFDHDKEKLGARAPKGMLLLHGITQQQWEDSLQAREATLDSLERRYYSGVQVLAASGDQTTLDAKLVALSNLPDDWDTESFIKLLMYGYALCFGYDPREFYPVSGGQLGSATETETQHTKATGKGGADFALNFQEQLQLQLPATLQFEFQQRDALGELMDVQVNQAKADLVTSLYNAGLMQGVPIITLDEARQMLAEAGVIPEEWTVEEEDVESTDIETARERALNSEQVRCAIETFYTEPIVAYHWPSGKSRTLWNSGEDAMTWKKPISRHIRGAQ